MPDIQSEDFNKNKVEDLVINDSGVASGSSSSNEDNNCMLVDPHVESRSQNEEVSHDNAQIFTPNKDVEIVNDKSCPDSINKCANDSTASIIEATPFPKFSKTIRKLGILKSKAANLNLDFNKLSSFTPSLKFNDDFIDLDDDELKTSTPNNKPGYTDLMDRFIKHSSAKKHIPKNQNLDLNIVTRQKAENGEEELVSSKLTVNLDEDDKFKPEEVPGAQLAKLKLTLKEKMIKQREEERQRRFNEKKFMENEEVLVDYKDSFQLPEDENELTDQSDTDAETESEPEENDIIISDKRRKRSKFVEDEAEDSDEMDDINNENSNDTVIVNHKTKRNDINDDDDDNEDELKLKWDESQDVDNDDDSSDLPNLALENSDEMDDQPKGSVLDRESSINSSFDLIGSVIPGHQPGGGMLKKQSSNDISDSPSKNKSFDMSRDNSFVFCGQGDDLGNTSANFSNRSIMLSPLQDSQFPVNEKPSGTKLDFSGLGNSQENSQELLGLCSGKFSNKDDLTQNIDELAGLCSGRFTKNDQDKISDLLDVDDKDDYDDDELLGLCTGKFTENKDDKISKLLDVDDQSNNENDELLGLCTGKFSSKLDKEESKSVDGFKKGNVDLDSDDEEGILESEIKLKRRKKRKRIMMLSDDEDARDATEFDEDSSEPNSDVEENPEFDDEENEIPSQKFGGFKDNVRGGIRSDFLENEAELSGSEIESGDEDEPNEENDIMEQEEGDLEEYDQEQLRDQVGKAHFKSELDEDKRQLRLLQEMLLEDGDLHGQGRQRKFRWKNINENDENDDQNNVEEENDQEEEQEEQEEWRKQRYEREKFIQESQEASKNDDFGFDKLIKNPLKRKSSILNTSVKEPLKPSNPVPSLNNNENSYDLFSSKISKKGSFLTRDIKTLSRFSETYKDKSNSRGGINQKGNFLFQQITAEEAQKKSSLSVKRSASTSLPSSNKRTKLDRSFLSMDETSKSSSIFKHL